MPIAHEYNFDGLIGPTHNYAGLSPGNLASSSHKGAVSHPKLAALQGLAKMKLLAELGVKQVVLPPQERPDLFLLWQMGFQDDDEAVRIERAWREAPHILAAACSASSMWAANMATVSPSSDTQDHLPHLTTANLISNLHREREASMSWFILRKIFPAEFFRVHRALRPSLPCSDEGAANHTRLCGAHGDGGIEIFTYGVDHHNREACHPQKFFARQSRDASAAIARLHRLHPDDTFFVQQHPAAIDAGVFHNDVIAVGHRDFFLCHERAYVDQESFLPEVSARFQERSGKPLGVIQVREDEVPLKDAVASYLFNSQIVSLHDDSMAIVCPIECMEHESTRRFLDDLLSRDTPIRQRHVVDLQQSMHNGGGPACLRLRIVLTESEAKAMHQGVIWSLALHEQLVAWVNNHYRDELRADDLRDVRLIREGRDALDELTKILDLPGLYDFQN